MIAPLVRPGIDDAVALRLFARLFFGRHDDAAADLVIGVHHLLQRAGLADHEIVGKHHGERLVPHQMARAPDRMSQPQGFLLPGEGDRTCVGKTFQQAVELLGLFPGGQKRFQLIGVVEMILDHMLAAAGDEDELLDAGFARFLHAILDHRLVDDRQHFFRNRLGGGQKTCAHSGDGKYGFTNAGCGHGRTDES